MIKIFGRKKDKKEEIEEAPETNEGLFQRLRQSLSKTSTTLSGRLDRLFLGKKEITEDLL